MPKLLELKGFLSFLVLHELSREKLCGEDLAKKIGKRKGDDPLTPGTIYPVLKQLYGLKLIAQEQDGRKKYYFLTSEGEKELKSLYFEFSRYFYGLKSFIRRPKRKMKKKNSSQRLKLSKRKKAKTSKQK